jgi:hypothetical protein
MVLVERVVFAKALAGATGSTGDPGTPGLQYANPTVYQWAATIPTGPTGSATYTWATGAYGSAPSGWSLTPGTSPSIGFTLWGATVALIASATDATTNFNWTSASITARGYAGSDGDTGGQGPQGGSARIAYAKTTATSLSATPTTYTTSGDTSFPPANTWGGSETWQGTVPSYSSGENVYQTNGVYDPVTDETVWGVPYLSALKVGSLSAISANLGTVTAGSIYSGLFSTASSGATTQRVIINESSSNELRVYADVGAGVEQTLRVGTHTDGSNTVFASFGTGSTGSYAIGVQGKTNTGFGVYGYAAGTGGIGVNGYAPGTSGRGVQGEGALYGVYASSSAGTALYATTSSGKAVHGFSSSGYAGVFDGAVFVGASANAQNYGSSALAIAAPANSTSYNQIALVRSGVWDYGIGLTQSGVVWFGHISGGALSGTAHMTIQSGGLTVNAAFGCNGKSMQAAYSVGSALDTGGSASNTDIATLINQLRTALINCGICV